jgi:hypothetical protein
MSEPPVIDVKKRKSAKGSKKSPSKKTGEVVVPPVIDTKKRVPPKKSPKKRSRKPPSKKTGEVVVPPVIDVKKRVPPKQSEKRVEKIDVVGYGEMPSKEEIAKIQVAAKKVKASSGSVEIPDDLVAKKQETIKQKYRYEDYWGKKVINTDQFVERGLRILIYGPAKPGKTRLGESACKVKNEIRGNIWIIPPFTPTFYIDLDENALAEAKATFKEEYKAEELIIFDAIKRTRDEIKKKKIKDVTPYVFNKMVFDKVLGAFKSLRNKERGCVVIDPISYADAMAFVKMVIDGLGQGFTLDGHATKKPKMFDYRYRNEYMETFKAQAYQINVILISHERDKYESEEEEIEVTVDGRIKAKKKSDEEIFYSKSTGEKIPDAYRKLSNWVDIICRMDFEFNKKENKRERVLRIVYSRFESQEDLSKKRIVNPTIETLLGVIEKYL